jgi:hypothetical protein
MKKHIIFALSAVLALGFNSCKDDETIEVGKWDSSADYAVVSFVETNKSTELDPAAETTVTLHMSRRNPELSEVLDAEEERVNQLLEEEEKNKNAQLEDTTLTPAQRAEIDSLYKQTVKDILAEYNEFVDSKCKANLDSIVVPIVITNGMDSIFTISPATFKQGEWVGEYTISFPEAKIGTTYEVQYAVTDRSYVSSYSEDATATFTVTRVKWVSVGTANLHDWVWWEDENAVEVLMKDGDPTKFRVLKPYGAMMEGYLGATPSEYTELTLLKVGDVVEGVKITTENLVYFTPMSTGYVPSAYGVNVIAWHPADLYASPNESMFLASRVLGYQKKTIEGKEYTIPGAINLAPYFYMSGVGGWNHTTDDKAVQIIMDGYKLKYEASLFTQGDFQWEKVMDGMFTSNQLKSKSEASLYKGTCVATQDNADSTFHANYGTPYILSEPYAEDYDIVFFVKDGRIQMPKDYDDYFGMQELGFEAAGMPVYGTINGSSSSFSDSEVKLNITFQAEREYVNANGRKAYEYITLDTNDEILANMSWNPVGTATYYYMEVDEEDNVSYDEDPGYIVKQRSDNPEAFMIEDWYAGGTLEFTWNQTTNAVSVPMCETGYEYQSYGMMYASDVAHCPYSETRGWSIEDYPSVYDPETNTFIFRLVYFVNGGTFGIYEDKMVVEWSASEAKAPLKKAARTMPKYFNLQKGAKVFGKYGNYSRKAKSGKKAKKTGMFEKKAPVFSADRAGIKY